PSGRTSRWGFDPMGRPVRLATGGHQVRFVLDAAGREIQRRVDDVVAVRQSFDSGGRLDHRTIAGVTDVAWAYDEADRVTAVFSEAGGERSFTADRTGRIRSVTADGVASERYDYDEGGSLVAAGEGRWQFDGSMLVRSDDATF